MKRALKIGATGLAIVALIVALAAVAIANFNWNRIRPWLGDKVSQAAGRSFAIDGDLELDWHRPQTEAGGWRNRIPWPHFKAAKVRMGNPDWARTGARMADIGQVEFSINPLALLAHRISIPTIVLRQPDLVLERAADGRNNWTFKHEEKPGKWTLDLGRVQLNDGRVRLVDAIRRADVTALLDSLPEADPAGYPLKWTLSGKLEGDAVQGKGRAGQLLALRDLDRPYPIDAELRVGSSRLAVAGTVARPRKEAALDLRLELSGQSMARLYPITTVLLPETSPYSTSGHLKGQMDDKGCHWTYENFKGKVGQSDIAGTLEYRGAKPRPRLEGTLESKLLRFEDLGSLIGAKPDTGTQKKVKARTKGDKTQGPAPGRVLPDKSFSTSRWKTLDADVKFTGHRILRSENLPIENLQTHLRLQDGVLRLSPLNFGVAGGQLQGNLNLDGREKTLKAELELAARHLQLKRLFPKVEEMRASIGELNGDAKLTATGSSVAALLGSSSGEVKALMERGTISKFVLEAIGLNIGSVIVTRLFGDRQVSINCAVSDFTVESGMMKTRSFVVDTTDAVIHVNGQINLARELLDLTINPESRNIRLLSLRSPLYVRGSFAHPDIAVDKAVLAAKTGGAVALGVLAPVVTALLPLVSAGDGENPSGCASLLAQARESAKAPAASRR